MRYSIAIANGAIEGQADFNWIHSNNQTFKASLRELAKSKYTFAILRDPFLRLASCFLDKMVDQRPPAWSYDRMTGYGPSPSELNFRQFVTQLKPHLRADEHWRPQIDYLVYKSYDDLFCVERLADMIPVLKQKIGLVVHDARALAKHGTDRFQPLEPESSAPHAADRTAFDLLGLKRSGVAPKLTDFYDDDLVKRVRALYADDIKLYKASFGKTVF